MQDLYSLLGLLGVGTIALTASVGLSLSAHRFNPVTLPAIAQATQSQPDHSTHHGGNHPQPSPSPSPSPNHGKHGQHSTGSHGTHTQPTASPNKAVSKVS